EPCRLIQLARRGVTCIATCRDERQAASRTAHLLQGVTSESASNAAAMSGRVNRNHVYLACFAPYAHGDEARYASRGVRRYGHKLLRIHASGSNVTFLRHAPVGIDECVDACAQDLRHR